MSDANQAHAATGDVAAAYFKLLAERDELKRQLAEKQRACDVLKDALDGEVNEGVRMRRQLCVACDDLRKRTEERDKLKAACASALAALLSANRESALSYDEAHAIPTLRAALA